MRNIYRHFLLFILLTSVLGLSLYLVNKNNFDSYFTSTIMDDKGITQVRGIQIPTKKYHLSQTIELKQVRTHYRDFGAYPVCLSMWVGLSNSMQISIVLDDEIFPMLAGKKTEPQTFCNAQLLYEKFQSAKQASIELKSDTSDGSSPGHITIGKNPNVSAAVVNGQTSDYVLPYKLTLSRDPLNREILAYIIVFFFASLVLFVTCREALLATFSRRNGSTSKA